MIYLSFAQEDEKVAIEVKMKLKHVKDNIEVISNGDAMPGEFAAVERARLIQQSHLVVALITSNQESIMQLEFLLALDQPLKGSTRKLIPLIIEKLPSRELLHPAISSLFSRVTYLNIDNPEWKTIIR